MSYKLKHALTFEEQIKRLKEFHKLNILDEKKAVEILTSVGYYRLSAYGIGLTKNTNQEEYKEGISLEYLFKLYQFDSSLRNLIMFVIQEIEIRLKTHISYYHSLKYALKGI